MTEEQRKKAYMTTCEACGVGVPKMNTFKDRRGRMVCMGCRHKTDYDKHNRPYDKYPYLLEDSDDLKELE
jgi:hypothetical protein